MRGFIRWYSRTTMVITVMISDDNLFSTVNLMVISTSRSLCNRAKIGTWVKCQCTFWILLVICITILTCWIRLNHGIFAAWASQNCIVTVAAAGSLHFGSGSTWTQNGLEHTGTRSSRSEMVRNGLNNLVHLVRICPNDLKWARGRQLCWLHDAPHVPGDSNWFTTESARLGTSLARPHSADKSWLQGAKKAFEILKARAPQIATYTY